MTIKVCPHNHLRKNRSRVRLRAKAKITGQIALETESDSQKKVTMLAGELGQLGHVPDPLKVFALLHWLFRPEHLARSILTPRLKMRSR
jgi:hypothetical protein